MNKLFWIGIAIIVLGSGPLLAIILFAKLGLTDDPNPNPIGPGMLAFLTFWPGVVVTIIGAVRGRRKMDPPKLSGD